MPRTTRIPPALGEEQFHQAMESFSDVLVAMGEDLKTRDNGQILGDLATYARSNPVSFLAGSAAIGFAAMRFAPAGSATANAHLKTAIQRAGEE
ncbi:hypothetical protein G5B39_15110 (plasmid) [Rhodobacteraceae bacterium SC52]|nr:hypothetical protein G5B39_15110 [Rhodobacteraceae bacterium SC52]